MKTIKTLFETIEIIAIQFEEGESFASVKCLLKQGEERVTSNIFIDFSDLNRLFSKLQQNNETLDYSELFEVCSINEKQKIYTSRTDFMQQLNCTVNEMEFYHPIQQIRA